MHCTAAVVALHRAADTGNAGHTNRVSLNRGRCVKVLKLSAQGLPQSWISLEQAVIHYAAEEVRWEVGQTVATFRGGHNARTGEQSIITVNSIIGTKGVPNINPFELRPGLTNAKLFTRDRNICAYCGHEFHESELTREHIIPAAQHGRLVRRLRRHARPGAVHRPGKPRPHLVSGSVLWDTKTASASQLTPFLYPGTPG